MIDCHCHLADEQFSSDIEEVIARAQKAQVLATLVCSEYSAQFEDVFRLAQRFKGFCFSCIGVHPLQKGNVSVQVEDMDGMEELVEQNLDRIAAIGEVGLDFTPRFLKLANAKEQQIAVFKRQIAIAIKHDLTLSVHSRSAGRPAIEILRECGARRVLMHAFDGNDKSAQPAIDCGYFFSIPPSFTHSERKIDLIKRIPLTQLCLETDSPVLGPSKSERNEPSNIHISAELIANIKGIPVDELIKITNENAVRLFPVLKCLLR
ncbi:unnamed protein product [Anisakis simplex]|uniref:Putative deoxyribonuclease TATDN3 (inferred by orthology to a human protein) n=1 Tax=Anisakis simplex TaxID=6269 RepID=A0A0M3JS22_ANISI|nr:unnamed protein product [Anisakis simplex]